MIPPICFAIRGNSVNIVELLLKQNDMNRTVQGVSEMTGYHLCEILYIPSITLLDVLAVHCFCGH